MSTTYNTTNVSRSRQCPPADPKGAKLISSFSSSFTHVDALMPTPVAAFKRVGSICVAFYSGNKNGADVSPISTWPLLGAIGTGPPLVA